MTELEIINEAIKNNIDVRAAPIKDRTLEVVK